MSFATRRADFGGRGGGMRGGSRGRGGENQLVGEFMCEVAQGDFGHVFVVSLLFPNHCS